MGVLKWKSVIVVSRSFPLTCFPAHVPAANKWQSFLKKLFYIFGELNGTWNPSVAPKLLKLQSFFSFFGKLVPKNCQSSSGNVIDLNFANTVIILGEIPNKKHFLCSVRSFLKQPYKFRKDRKLRFFADHNLSFFREQNIFCWIQKTGSFFKSLVSFSLTDVPAGAVEPQFGERQGSQGPESMPRAYVVISYVHAHFAQVFLSASVTCWLRSEESMTVLNAC